MTNIRKIRCIVLIALMLIVPAFLSGCGKDVPVNAVIIGCGHGNMPVFSAECDAIHNNMYDAAYTYGEVTMLTCDGSPQVFFQASIPEPNAGGLSNNKKRMIAEDYTDQLQAAYYDGAPETPEVNTLKAISQAARSLSGAEGEKRLVIIDSGLQTTGYINFTNGLLDAEPEDIIEALAGMHALPDLSGVKVTWIGLGDTIAPQKELSERQKVNLRNIWEGVLYAAGADSVVFDGEHSTNTAYEGVPAVTTVPVEAESLYIPISEKKQSAVPLDTMILDSTRLQFLGDQAVFVNEAQAEKVLAEVAEKLIAHPANNVFVIGTTAGSGGNSDYTIRLSDARANTVRDRLISMGVPPGQMTAVGLGSTDPFHEWDLDENGQMIEEIAKKNRKTIIMDVNSPEAGLLP